MSTVVGTISASPHHVEYVNARHGEAGSIALAGDELAADIGLYLDHESDLRVGTVELIARTRSARLVAVASVEGSVDRDHWRFLSVGVLAYRRSSTEHERGTITECSLVAQSSAIGSDPVRWHARSLTDGRGQGGWSQGSADVELLNLAVADHEARRLDRYRTRAAQRLIVDVAERDWMAAERARRQAAEDEARRKAARPTTSTVMVPGVGLVSYR